MSALLAETYRRFFRVALGNPSSTGHDPDRWAGIPSLWKESWRNPGRFLDVGTLLFSLFDKHTSLDQWCAEFQRKGYAIDRKLDHQPSGRVTQEELRYCRRDVKVTLQLLNAAKQEFDIHPLPKLLPDKSYSPASLAKAYMREMNIIEPLKKFNI